MTDALLDLVKSLLHSAFDSFDTMVQQACTVLTGGISNSLWNTVVGMSEALIPFCNIIIAICMLIELAQVASKVDLVKWEHGLKIGCKLALAKVCIEIAPTFLHACYNQACLFIDYLAGMGADVALGHTVGALIDGYIDSITGLGNALGLLVTTLLLQMGIKICGIMVVVIAYGRMFEILVYLMVSPLPCAFFPLGNGNGDGVSRITTKFFKSFIAVCLQGLMMFICIRLFGTVIGSSFQAMVDSTIASGAEGATMVSDLCWDMILFTIVLVMSVSKCSSWANSIIDAN